MRAAAAVERIGLMVMVYVGETLLITPYDEMEFGKYKSNEGYLRPSGWFLRLRSLSRMDMCRWIRFSPAAKTQSP